GIERTPAAVLALHAKDPFARARDRLAVASLTFQILGAIHRHRDHGSVGDVENLLLPEPFKALVDLRQRALAAYFQKRMAGEPGVPDRREAGLAVGFL